MSKILIVTDSSASIDLEVAKQHGIEIVPLSVELEGKVYRDQLDMTGAELREKLKQKAAPKTSQPNLGYVNDLMKRWKGEGWDDVIIFSLSSNLSGTYQGFHLAMMDNDMTNVTLVDTLTLAGPLRDIVFKAASMVKEGKTKEEILAMAQTVIDMTQGFLIPENLDQLVRGGRVSPALKTVATLLKLRTLAVLRNKGKTFDKAGTSRTEAGIFKMVIDDFAEKGVAVGVTKFVICECEAQDIALRLKSALVERFGPVDVDIIDLPATLTAHAGLRAVSIQSSLVL
jgi:DegV family protein with EDD domain